MSKLPPLVPEFSNIVTRTVPANSQVENIPNAEKLSSNPTNGEAVEGTSQITETLGVFHSPEEFVAKAVTTGHPHGMKQCLREVLKGAIKTNIKELSIAQRARKRTLKIKQWMAWAEELAQEEKELKASMHVDVKAILAQKKIKLWERLLCDVNYADMGVAQELIQGTSLVGEVEQCVLWPAKFSPALITEVNCLRLVKEKRQLSWRELLVRPTPSQMRRSGKRQWLRWA